MGLYPKALLTPAAIIDGEIDTYDLIGDALSSIANCDNDIAPGKTVLIPNERREGYDWSEDSIDPREGGMYQIDAARLEGQLQAFRRAYATDLAKLPEHRIALVFAAYQS